MVQLKIEDPNCPHENPDCCKECGRCLICEGKSEVEEEICRTCEGKGKTE